MFRRASFAPSRRRSEPANEKPPALHQHPAPERAVALGIEQCSARRVCTEPDTFTRFAAFGNRTCQNDCNCSGRVKDGAKNVRTSRAGHNACIRFRTPASAPPRTLPKADDRDRLSPGKGPASKADDFQPMSRRPCQRPGPVVLRKPAYSPGTRTAADGLLWSVFPKLAMPR